MAPRKTPKLQRIRKAWQKGLRSLPLASGRRVRPQINQLDPIPIGENVAFDVTPDEEVELANALGNTQLARRVMALKKKYPYATFIELIMVDYLDKVGEKYKFTSQAVWWLSGWRASP